MTGDTVDVRCPECDKLNVRVVRPADCTLDLQCTRCKKRWRVGVHADASKEA